MSATREDATMEDISHHVEQEAKVRKEKDESALKAMIGHVRFISKVGSKQVEIMTDRFKLRMMEREIEHSALAESFLRLRARNNELMTIIDDFQKREASPMQQPVANVPVAQPRNLAAKQMEKMLEAHGIKSTAKADAVSLRQRLGDEQCKSKELKLKLDIAENEISKLRKKLEDFDGNVNSNSYTRRDFGRNIDARSACSSSPSTQNCCVLSCRCTGHPCMFFPDQKTKPGLKTPSPTHFNRMRTLLKLNPNMDAAELRLVAQSDLPIREDVPSEETLLLMAHCPTLFLVCKDIPGWYEAFKQFAAHIAERAIGKELLNPCSALVVLAPGTDISIVPLTNQKILSLDRPTKAEHRLSHELRQNHYHLVIIVLSVDVSEEVRTLWKSLISIIHKETEIMVVMGPKKNEDHSQNDNFVTWMMTMERNEGNLRLLSPMDRSLKFGNRQLINLRDVVSTQDYWREVYTMVKDRGWMWPKFGVMEDGKSSSSGQRRESSRDCRQAEECQVPPKRRNKIP